MSAFAAAEQLPVEVIGSWRARLGESPLWAAAEGVLWWVDIDGCRLHRLVPDHGAELEWKTPGRPGCIGLAAGGGLVAAIENRLCRLRAEAGKELAVEPLAEVRLPRVDMRFNDGRVDRCGRFWATTIVADTALGIASGALFRLDAGGVSAPLLEGLVTGNGSAFSADGRTMYLADSHPSVRKIWSFELHADGSLGTRRLFVDMAKHAPGRPDGAAIDADGCYWTCATDAGALLRFTPAGNLDRVIALPVAKPTMPAFGGGDLGDLYVTSLQPKRPPAGYDPALAGALLVLRPGVRGLAETAFRG